MRIVRYTADFSDTWNDFIRSSKNGTFLLERTFMDYHSDRFDDHSLCFFKENELIAVLPANEKDTSFYSHQGLTYGDLIVSKRCSLLDVQKLTDQLLIYLKEHGFNKFYLKMIPSFYHKFPSQEFNFSLFKHKPILYKKDVATIIDLEHPLPIAKGRKSQISKAKKQQYNIEKSTNFNAFMELERRILETKYNTTPTHSTEEIIRLSNAFPENIQLYTCCKNELIHAGIIVFISDRNVHCQYIATTEEGRSNGALDLLISHLICKFTSVKKYFEFGISTENDGFYLNEGLHYNKESYGARSVVYEGYLIEI